MLFQEWLFEYLGGGCVQIWDEEPRRKRSEGRQVLFLNCWRWNACSSCGSRGNDHQACECAEQEVHWLWAGHGGLIGDSQPGKATVRKKNHLDTWMELWSLHKNSYHKKLAISQPAYRDSALKPQGRRYSLFGKGTLSPEVCRYSLSFVDSIEDAALMLCALESAGFLSLRQTPFSVHLDFFLLGKGVCLSVPWDYFVLRAASWPCSGDHAMPGLNSDLL